MKRLRFLTAGESHGPALVGILEGLPAHLPVDASDVDRDLARRQKGYGRGGRMAIEKDAAEILSGVRFGETLGSPVALLLHNRDFKSWTERMPAAFGGPDPRPVLVPRPGHADLAGAMKYGHEADLRNVLERASARETAMRVALGGLAKALLRDLGVQVGSYVRSIGGEQAEDAAIAEPILYRDDAEALALRADETATRTLSAASSKRLEDKVDEARGRRDTVGGVVEVVVTNLPVGIGSYVHADRKLDGRLAAALASIPAIKAVEIGDGWLGGVKFGSEQHDPLFLQDGRVRRSSNHAGGLEGGVTTSEPLVLRATMKPIATVSAALPSFNLRTHEAVPAHVERSDTCAVPAAGVVAEAVVALELADALLETLGGDTMDALRRGFASLRLKGRVRPGHVFLLGPMGVGKTSAGAQLGVALGLPFVDLDERVERQTGATLRALFEQRGEAAFRALEAEALQEVCGEGDSVVALGGGTPLNETAWRRMRSAGVCVRLDAPVDLLIERMQRGDPSMANRPLLAGADPRARLQELLHQRERWYARADLRLSTPGLSAEQVASACVGMIRGLEGPLARAAGRDVP